MAGSRSAALARLRAICRAWKRSTHGLDGSDDLMEAAMRELEGLGIATIFERMEEIDEWLAETDSDQEDLEDLYADDPQLEELAKNLSQQKMILQGTTDLEIIPEQVHALVVSVMEDDYLLRLAIALRRVPFETRRDIQLILSYVLRYVPPGAGTTTEPMALNFVVHRRPQVLVELCNAYKFKDCSAAAGTVIKEVIKNADAQAIILFDDGQEPGSSFQGVEGINQDRKQSGNGSFWKFFDYIDKSTFEVAADAFTTFREILTNNKQMVAKYLSLNFDLFFLRYHTSLIQSKSYVTRRQSIKLLGEMLLDRANYDIMVRYVADADHLKICMNLLRDERKMIQFEAFHVFKVFVANPRQSVPVQKILLNNRPRLINYLNNFLNERTDDEQFVDEKGFLIKSLMKLPQGELRSQLEQQHSSAGPSG